jgi:hypothetical protein
MAVGADVLQLLTTYWIGNLAARKTSTYGAVGIALAVLLWVYVLGRIMVASAGLNAALYYRRENRTGQAGSVQLTRVLSGSGPAVTQPSPPLRLTATAATNGRQQRPATAARTSCPRDVPELPSTANDRRRQHPAHMKLGRALNPRPTHGNPS